MLSSKRMRLIGAGFLACLLFAGAASAAGKNPWRGAFSLTHSKLVDLGINPEFIVAVRVHKNAQRVVLAEHRPGADSLLHVFDGKGARLFQVSVPSPQLADFALSPDGEKAFLVGSYGSRFYTADLAKRQAKLTYSSEPDQPGFRALAPIGIWQSSKGPVVYGLFYESDKVSRDLGFAAFPEDGPPALVFATTALEKEFDRVVSYAPNPSLKSVLIVNQDPQPQDPAAKPKERRLHFAEIGGRRVALDSAADVFATAWLPDGKTLAYVRKSENDSELILREVEGQPKAVARGLFSPAFLSGGKWIVASMLQEKKQEVWVANRATGELLHMGLPEGACLYNASQDGSALVAWGPWGIRAFRFS
ncbi:MAG: hypothetical protein HY922_02300 [Elusimicrobia bacterium]|nr:hypothetical protein [Elusimicrobiota bacterium]